MAFKIGFDPFLQFSRLLKYIWLYNFQNSQPRDSLTVKHKRPFLYFPGMEVSLAWLVFHSISSYWSTVLLNLYLFASYHDWKRWSSPRQLYTVPTKNTDAFCYNHTKIVASNWPFKREREEWRKKEEIRKREIDMLEAWSTLFRWKPSRSFKRRLNYTRGRLNQYYCARAANLGTSGQQSCRLHRIYSVEKRDCPLALTNINMPAIASSPMCESASTRAIL